MARLKYLCLHCSDTPPGLIVGKNQLTHWHMAPRDHEGSVIYLGKRYASRDHLPNHYFGEVHIKELHGRGWDRLGYERVFHRTGHVEVLTKINDDDIIEAHEMTWGAAGINSCSVHWMLEGGWAEDEQYGIFDFFEIFTDEQYLHLQWEMKSFLGRHPHVQVIGHNNVSSKTCPNFNVQELCRMLPIPEANIYTP